MTVTMITMETVAMFVKMDNMDRRPKEFDAYAWDVFAERAAAEAPYRFFLALPGLGGRGPR